MSYLLSDAYSIWILLFFAAAIYHFRFLDKLQRIISGKGFLFTCLKQCRHQHRQKLLDVYREQKVKQGTFYVFHLSREKIRAFFNSNNTFFDNRTGIFHDYCYMIKRLNNGGNVNFEAKLSVEISMSDKRLLLSIQRRKKLQQREEKSKIIEEASEYISRPLGAGIEGWYDFVFKCNGFSEHYIAKIETVQPTQAGEE